MTSELLMLIQQQALTKHQPKELLQVLHNVKDHPEIFEFIEANLPMVDVNGKTIIDPLFQKDVYSFDVVEFAESFSDSNNIQDKETLGVTLIAIAALSALKEVVRTVSMDFSERGSTWEEYLNGVQSLGFQEVLELEKVRNNQERNDIVKFFWNYDHSALWIVDSFSFSEGDIKVNSSNLYLHGIKRDRSQHHGMPLGHSIVFNSDVSVISCDMRENPTNKFFELIEKFETTKYWLEYNCYSPELKANFTELPEDIQAFMTSRISSQVDLEKSHTKKKEMHKTADAFIFALSRDDLKLGVAWVSHFGYENTKSTRLPESFYKIMENFTDNVDVNFESYISEVLFSMRKDFQEDEEHLDVFFVKNASDEVLKMVYDKHSERTYVTMNKTAYAMLESKFSNVTVM